jgi:hypothetical protein
MALDSTVKVKFLGDAANLAREAQKASRATAEVGKSAETAHRHLSTMAKSFIAGAGIGVAAVGIQRFAKSSVDAFKNAAAEASKLSRLTGLAAEDASRLGFAAHETGQDADNFAKALGLLSKNLANADKAQTVLTKSHHLAIQQVPRLVHGHIEYAAKLVQVTDTQKKTVAGTQSLGFALRDASGHLRPLNELLPLIADKFKAMQDGPEKTALALKLFGRGGAQLLPFLNKGAEGLAKFGEEADKLGITMSGKDVTAYRAYIRAQREFHAAMNGVKITLGRELFPLFTAWSTALAENAPQINATAREYVGKLVPAIQKAATWVKELIQGFHDGKGAGGDLREAMSTAAGAAKALGDVLIPMVRFLAEHPHVFESLAVGVVAFKVAAAGAAFKASALGTAIFGVRDAQVAAAGTAPAATGAMTGLGAAASTALGQITLALGAAYAAYKLYDEIVKRLNNPDSVRNANAGTPSATVATPPQNPVIDFNGQKYAANGTGLVPALPPLHPQNPRVPDPHEHGAPTPASNEVRNRDVAQGTSVHQAAADEAAKARAAQAASDKANKDALDAQLKQAAAADKAAEAKQKAADALQKATDAMRQALTDRLETAKGIKGSIIGSLGVIREGMSWTAKDLLSRFRVQMDKVKRLSAAIQEMVRKGFSPAIIQEAAQAGVANLGAVVALSHATAPQVQQFNAAAGTIDRAAGRAAGAVVGATMPPMKLEAKFILGSREIRLLAQELRQVTARDAANGHVLAT